MLYFFATFSVKTTFVREMLQHLQVIGPKSMKSIKIKKVYPYMSYS